MCQLKQLGHDNSQSQKDEKNSLEMSLLATFQFLCDAYRRKKDIFPLFLHRLLPLGYEQFLFSEKYFFETFWQHAALEDFQTFFLDISFFSWVIPYLSPLVGRYIQARFSGLFLRLESSAAVSVCDATLFNFERKKFKSPADSFSSQTARSSFVHM